MGLTLTPARLAANRRNAIKGGRPPGRKNRKTLILEAAKQEFDLAVAAKVDELLALQLRIAHQVDESPAAANGAVNSLLDRAFGKPAQRIEEVGPVVRDKIKIIHIYAPDSDPPDPHTAASEPYPPKRPH